jgi:hypothetical protein
MICSPSKNPHPARCLVKRPAAAPPAEGAHEDFVRLLPTVRKHARICFRQKRPEEREELVAECLANAFRAFLRLRELGKAELIYPTVLAKFAVKQVHDGRRLGTLLNRNEILSCYAQRRQNFRVERLEGYDSAEEAWREAVLADSATPVPEQVAFRVDFTNWLARYGRPKRRVAAALAVDYTTNETAQRFKLSAARVSQLRREFEKSWESFQGESAGAAVKAASA